MLQNRKQFNEELESLNEKVINMGVEVIGAYENLYKACIEKDNELLDEIIDYDKFINDIEVSVNVDGYLLIARQCPVASDLRRVIIALKISNDLERIADYAVNIAKYLRTYSIPDQVIESFIKLLDIFMEMLKGVITAFKDEDQEYALKINEKDDILDKEYLVETTKLMKQVKDVNNDEEIERIMKAILSLKQIERGGDHVTNISESIIYFVTGKRIELN